MVADAQSTGSECARRGSREEQKLPSVVIRSLRWATAAGDDTRSDAAVLEAQAFMLSTSSHGATVNEAP